MRFAGAGCTFRGRILTGLDGILVGSDRWMEVKCAFRRGRVHVSWQDPDGIGQDPGGIRSTDGSKMCVSPGQGARFVARPRRDWMGSRWDPIDGWK